MGAHFRPENVNDHVAGVDKHPVALPLALDPHLWHAGFFDVLDDVLGDGRDVALGAAGGHHHEVRDRGFTGEIDADTVLGFHVFQTREDDAERLLGTRAPGDGFGQTT